MQQAHDFLAESEELHALIGTLCDAQLGRATDFKQWTVESIVRHLHVWNCAVEMALGEPEAFRGFVRKVTAQLAGGSLRDFEAEYTGDLAGADLVRTWHDGYVAIAARFAGLDPSLRLPWVGPGMSARSAMTARQMETWAHGQAIYDLLGIARENHDRIRNVVVLGVKTYGWTFRVNGREAPAPMPFLRLTAPSGEVWTFGEENDAQRIDGRADEFCQVVTQVRNVADTALAVRGDNAAAWMAIAQCFAGPPETPPAPGTRARRIPAHAE